jgi:hypothetical protein
MKNIKITFVTLFLLIIHFNLFSQVISGEVSGLKRFFEKMETKGFFRNEYFSDALSIEDILKRLEVLKNNYDKLTNYDKLELNHYLKVYDKFIFSSNDAEENFHFLDFNLYRRFDLFKYKDSNFVMVINPAINLTAENLFDHKQLRAGRGLSSVGKMKNGFGFSFYFMDNLVYNGDYWNKLNFTTEQGRILTRNVNNRSEFSDTRGSVTYQNNWILISFMKENLKLGNGENSSLILSTKAPSSPSIYLRLNLTDWLTVYSLHGWLLSGITDSSRSYQTNYNYRNVSHEKYFALHAVTFQPFDWWNMTFGETIVYSDRGPYLGYLIPFLFYRSVDHTFTYGGGESGNNGSFFFENNFYFLNQIKIYSSFFIDEFSLSGILKGKSDRNQSAYTVGIKSFDLPMEKFSFAFEYTKILPWVYSNWIPAQTYTNLNYPLGHYIGQNSDQIYFKVGYDFNPILYLGLDMEYTRNGGISDIKNQYTPPGEEFLYGLRRTIKKIGFDIRYNLFDNIILRGNYSYFNIKDEDHSRTPNWQQGDNSLITIGLVWEY